jgi:TonB family protein
MAHSPISRPDDFDAVGSSAEMDSAQSWSRWMSTLAACGGGPLAADLALDLVLNDIGERARAATSATAAAIALARAGEIVCRATTGENAPDLGVPLNTQAGLSAACVQTRQWQHCEDTELDDRVDPEVCRRLGVRSIVVFPILKKAELLGIIEIFGSRPRAFSSREIGILEALSREVVESVDRAAAVQEKHLTPESVPDVSLESLQAAVPKGKERDFWTDALTLLVIALALLLGWVVGRAGWRSTGANSSVRGRQVSQSRGAAPSSVAASSAQLPEESAAPPVGSGNSGATVAENGLTVYQNGRVVFRTSDQERKEDSAKGSLPTAAQANNTVGVPRLRISPEIANEYLVRRVEPEYPQPAREKRIQGPVVIDAIVGREGEVEKLISIRGDAQLLAAATAAIRQWRFQPFLRNGQPEAFQTRITLDFKLP